MPLELFTIGHSTHTWDAFVVLLIEHGIKALADIRRFPGSRKHPQFGKDHFAAALPEAGIEYRWLEALGGRRGTSKNPESANQGLRNESFRNYADYMQTAAFRAGIEELLSLVNQKRTAYMCSEGLFWRCHRRLVSDYLLARGISIQHIMPNGKLQPHALTSGAIVREGVVTYPAPDSTQPQLFD